MDLLDTKTVQQGLPGLLADKQINLLKNAVESGEGKKSEKLKSLSKQFESLMTHQLLTAMRTTVPKSELMGGFSGDMYQSMMDQELAAQMSKGKGLGIGDMVHRQLVQLEKKTSSAPLESQKLESLGISLNTVKQPIAINSETSGLTLKSSDVIDSSAGSKMGIMMRVSKSYRGNR